MQKLNLVQMPISEKFLMIEELGEDLGKQAMYNGFTPIWYIDVLNER